MIRVGTDEVYITPDDGKVVPAYIAVIRAVNRECQERGIEHIFGEPSEIDSKDWGGLNTREVYAHADVVHVNGERARIADPTIRIVPKDDLARDIFTKVYPALRDRIALAQYAHTIPGVDREALASWNRERKEVINR